MSINTWCTVQKENTWTSSLVSILSRVFTFSLLFFFLFHFVLQLRSAELDLALVCQLWLCFWVEILFLILESPKKTWTHQVRVVSNLHNAMSCILSGLYSYLKFTELHENATERHFRNSRNSKGITLTVSPRWTSSFRFYWN